MPVIGTLKTPSTPNPLALIAMVVEPGDVGFGLKVIATPEGTFEGPRPTVPENALTELIVT